MRETTLLRGLPAAEQAIVLRIGYMGGGWRRTQVVGSYVALPRNIRASDIHGFDPLSYIEPIERKPGVDTIVQGIP